MATKTTFDDPALGNGVYVGDLKYGRCNGTNLNKHHDYPANPEGGKATNLPAVPLVLKTQRDPAVWGKRTKQKKVSANFQDLKDQLLMRLNSETGGLMNHIRVVKFDKKLLVVKN